MKLVFATRNEGKRRELAALVPQGLEVLSLGQFPEIPDVVEDGETFEENAKKKALAVAQATGLVALADDSGLAVDALGGAPGVHSARYAPGEDAARNRKLLGALAALPGSPRSARFVCVLCLAWPNGDVRFARGECEGEIALESRGTGGFGYDPVFYVPALGKTFGEVSAEEKSARSHRGRALEAMRPHLLALADAE